MDALIIRLKGAMAAWGTLTVGDNRETAAAPSQSALLGMLGACCGIDRRDSERLDRWFDLWHTVILYVTRRRGEVQPRRFYDFHSARNTLKLNGDLNTDPQIGYRGYLQEALAIVAFVLRERSDPRLQSLARTCLEAPVYTPYLGRLCNPFSAPPFLKQGSYESLSTLLADMQRLLLTESSEQEGAVTHMRRIVPQALVARCGERIGGMTEVLPDRRNGAVMSYRDHYCLTLEIALP